MPDKQPAHLITTTEALAALCAKLHGAPFVTVDTEFMRETTYWPKLCLVQLAGPDDAAAVDPLAPGIDLAPMHALMADEAVLKVFHAARQDIEIFHHLTGRVPKPLFDSQVAAMVCGFGDSVSYDTLVSRLAGKHVDKSSRFTNWAQRPLTERQITYALADVTHLRVVYQKLEKRLEKTERAAWLAEEMAALTSPSTYEALPGDAWKRLRSRSSNRRFLGVLRELAAWRELEAQKRDLPRNRVVKDEALLEIAAHVPKTVEELGRTRALGRTVAEGAFGRAMMEAIVRAQALPDDALPEAPTRPQNAQIPEALMDLLRVLLKHKCEENHVAQKLVANTADLERIAADDEPDVAALHGWRREVFGEAALALKGGKLALAAKGRKVALIPLDKG